MKTKNAADAATVPSTARGIARFGSRLSSPIEAAASKPTNSRIASSTPLNAVEIDVVPGLKTDSVLPSAPPLTTITTPSSSIGTNEIADIVSIAPIAMRTPM